MKKKITLILLIVCAPFFLKAQHHSIEFNSDAGLFNSAFSVETILNSLDYIDDNQKLELLGSMSDENSIYLDVNNEIKYTSPKGISLAFGNHVNLYGLFGDDIFKLVLYGNTSMLGQEIDLLPMEGFMYHYSDITFGYKFSDKLSASLSLIAGHQFVSGEFSKLNITSGEFGETLGYDVSVEGVEVGDWGNYFDNTDDLFVSDGKFGNLFNSNGQGFSVGFDYTDEKFGGTYKLSVSDLGYIDWNEEVTNHFKIVNSDELEPIQIDDISDIDTDTYINQLDTFEVLLQPYLKSHKFVLPSRLSGFFNKDISNNLVQSYTVSFEHRVGLYTVPRVSLDLHRVVKQHEFILGYHLGGLQQQGFQFKYQYNSKNVRFSAFTKEANFVDVASSYGFHLGVGLGFYL